MSTSDMFNAACAYLDAECAKCIADLAPSPEVQARLDVNAYKERAYYDLAYKDPDIVMNCARQWARLFYSTVVAEIEK